MKNRDEIEPTGKEISELFPEFMERLKIRMNKNRKQYVKPESSKGDRVLYHATSSPMDHYEGYRPIFMMGSDLYKEEMEGNHMYRASPREFMSECDLLLVDIIKHMTNLFFDYRGEKIYYRLEDLYDRTYLVLLFKCDTNGEMQAFSYNYEALIDLPHDYMDSWKMGASRIVENNGVV